MDKITKSENLLSSQGFEFQERDREGHQAWLRRGKYPEVGIRGELAGYGSDYEGAVAFIHKDTGEITKRKHKPNDHENFQLHQRDSDPRAWMHLYL